MKGRLWLLPALEVCLPLGDFRETTEIGFFSPSGRLVALPAAREIGAEDVVFQCCGFCGRSSGMFLAEKVAVSLGSSWVFSAILPLASCKRNPSAVRKTLFSWSSGCCKTKDFKI